MEEYSEQEYLYIRGFLITNMRGGGRPSQVNKQWHELEFGINEEYVIYFDPKNEIEYICDNERYILLLGTFMNTETGCMDKRVLINEMFGCLKYGEKELYEYVNILGGRHIIVFCQSGGAKLITDATAMRSTYYYTQKGECFISSHYNLIHNIVQTEEHAFYKEYCEYKKTKYICVSLPGDMTPWKDIRMLIPNHVLSLTTNTIERFFPVQRLQDITISEACDYISSNIKIQYEELAKHYDILHSMTAGCDSRICLSAAKNIKDRVTLFTYHNENPNLGDKEQLDREQNFIFAKELARNEGIKHIEVFFKGPYPEDLMKIMDKNHYHRVNRLIKQLSASYPFKENTLHVRSSIVEMCRNTDHIMVNYYRSRCEKFALWAQYSGILKDAVPYFEDWAERNQVNGLDELGYSDAHIHYWENRLPTWMNASVVLEDDILCDTWMLFNVRKILSMGLRLQEYWRQKNVVFREIINRLWPELLRYNLPNSRKLSYDLIDHHFKGCFNFEKCEHRTGSSVIVNRAVEGYFEIRDYGCCFGFADSSVKRGDYCEIELEYDVEKDKSYYFEFNIFTIWQDFVPDNIVNYMILIDRKEVFLESCNNFNGRVNQILYLFRATDTAKKSIVIRLQCVKDCNNNNYNGVIDIKSVTLRREWIKNFDTKPAIYSTSRLLKKCQEE